MASRPRTIDTFLTYVNSPTIFSEPSPLLVNVASLIDKRALLCVRVLDKMQPIDKIMKVTAKEVIANEFPVYKELGFSLFAESSEVMPHLVKLQASQEYLDHLFEYNQKQRRQKVDISRSGWHSRPSIDTKSET
jgi:hypothetical protein